MNRPLKNFLDVLLCIAIFAVVQIFIQLAVAGIYSFVKEVDFTTVSDGLTAGKYSDLIVVSSVLSSLVTLLVFTFGKFAVISRNYLASHPWGTLAWVALLSVGLILPAEWVYERLQITMPESTEAMFEGIMREPLGYMAIGIFAPVVEAIVSGVAEGCRQAGCALVGGETAEMPGMYAPEDYDIAGFTVGAVEKEELIDGSKVAEGDVLIGLPSTGVHSNGFSLVRKIVADAKLDLNSRYEETGEQSLGEMLLTPTAIYVKPVLKLIKTVEVHGVAHITGGGFDENIPRILSEGLGVEIKDGSWDILPVFDLLRKYGNLPRREMFNIFNMGIGMVIALRAQDAEKAIETLRGSGIEAREIGKVVKGTGVTLV